MYNYGHILLLQEVNVVPQHHAVQTLHCTGLAASWEAARKRHAWAVARAALNSPTPASIMAGEIQTMLWSAGVSHLVAKVLGAELAAVLAPLIEKGGLVTATELEVAKAQATVMAQSNGLKLRPWRAEIDAGLARLVA